VASDYSCITVCYTSLREIISLPVSAPLHTPKQSLSMRQATGGRAEQLPYSMMDGNRISLPTRDIFYLYLLLFGNSLAIGMLGMPMGKISIAQPLNRQPAKCMVAVNTAELGGLESLRSFDIWHQSLDFAEAYYTQHE
jgi:hypothetical protein